MILVPIFVAESFETFLMDNGIKHRKTTPLWPRPMVRWKAKKRSLLKRMLKAQVEGKNWKEAVMKYLVACRNTPYKVQACLSELLFERKLDTKLPSLREVAKVDEEVMDRDQDIKGRDEEVYGQNA